MIGLFAVLAILFLVAACAYLVNELAIAGIWIETLESRVLYQSEEIAAQQETIRLLRAEVLASTRVVQ